MKTQMTFYGSCGHVETTDIDDAMWTKLTTQTGYSAIGPLSPNYFVESSDGSARMVYVYPGRYCDCAACFQASALEFR